MLLPDWNRSPWAVVPNDQPPANDVVGPPAVPVAEHAACPEQWAYVISEAPLSATCCSRRAGKTNGAILKAAGVLSRPGTWGHYINLRRRNALTQFFYPLLDYLERPRHQNGLGWVKGRDFWANESTMIVTTAWGSNLKAASCPTMADVSAVKGDRSDWFCIDECQEPNDDVIVALVETAATPMLTDTGGQLDLLGTPPEAEPCYFSDALDSEEWDHHAWTQFQHDLPRPREAKWEHAKESFRRRHLALDVTEANDNGRLVLSVGPGTHPIIQREYFGRRVKDPTKVAYEYQPGWNDYDPTTVDFSTGAWKTVWGLDLGYGDHDAIVIASMRLDDPERRIYVRWSWHHRHLDVFDDADMVRAIKDVLPTGLVVGDDGGHGAKKTLVGLGRVLGLNIQPKPRDVMTSLGQVNDDLRARRLLLPLKDIYTPKILAAARRLFAADSERLEAVERMVSNTPSKDVPDNAPLNLTKELAAVIKSVNPRTKKIEINKKGLHSDGTEALRYLHSGFVRAPDAPKQLAVVDEETQRLAQRRAYLDAISRERHRQGTGRRF